MTTPSSMAPEWIRIFRFNEIEKEMHERRDEEKPTELNENESIRMCLTKSQMFQCSVEWTIKMACRLSMSNVFVHFYRNLRFNSIWSSCVCVCVHFEQSFLVCVLFCTRLVFVASWFSSYFLFCRLRRWRGCSGGNRFYVDMMSEWIEQAVKCNFGFFPRRWRNRFNKFQLDTKCSNSFKQKEEKERKTTWKWMEKEAVVSRMLDSPFPSVDLTSLVFVMLFIRPASPSYHRCHFYFDVNLHMIQWNEHLHHFKTAIESNWMETHRTEHISNGQPTFFTFDWHFVYFSTLFVFNINFWIFSVFSIHSYIELSINTESNSNGRHHRINCFTLIGNGTDPFHCHASQIV